MEIQRKQDIAVYYWLADLFSSIPEITIVDEYPDNNLVLPTISVEDEFPMSMPIELGNSEAQLPRLWNINVFGKTKTQRDSMTYTILNNLKTGVDVYDYDVGFPPSEGPKIGHLSILQDSITATKIKVFPELVEKLYWRTSIRFITEYNNFS